MVGCYQVEADSCTEAVLQVQQGLRVDHEHHITLEAVHFGPVDHLEQGGVVHLLHREQRQGQKQLERTPGGTSRFG